MQIPDNVRPYVDAVVKHHFWLLALLVPIVVLPAVLAATGDLDRKIKERQREIDGKLASLQTVKRNADHPNEKWAEVLRRDTAKIKRDTLREWERFWEEQSPLRVWPEPLGADFIERASRLQPGGKLARSLLERYHNGIRGIVRTLPKRMGAEEAMRGEGAAERGGPASGRSQPDRSLAVRTIIRWNASDQKRLYDSFDWQKPPSTAQVQLAQEELWLYEMLCDTIAAMNARATGAFDSVIPYVDELAVGYPAAEDKPGGVGEGRVLRVTKTANATDSLDDSETGSSGMKSNERPNHPRFAGGSSSTSRMSLEPDAEGEMPAATPAANADDLLRNWIYVDFDGKPLMASDLTASMANRMIHLVPFRLRAVIDQRRIDDLLEALARSKVPVDVRQVRVNPGASKGMAGSEGGAPTGKRPFDVTVELRGSIALATPPDRKAVMGDAEGEEPAADDPAGAVEGENP